VTVTVGYTGLSRVELTERRKSRCSTYIPRPTRSMTPFCVLWLVSSAMLLLLLYVQTLFRPSALDGCGIGPVVASRVQTCLLAGRNDILREAIGAIGQTCCEVSVSRVYNDCRGVGRAKVPGWSRIMVGWILDDSSTDVCKWHAACFLLAHARLALESSFL
jgi:hypothetical protein